MLNDCVADLAMALMLDVGRRISETDRFVRRGSWTTPGAKSFPLARKVSGAKLGIVGFRPHQPDHRDAPPASRWTSATTAAGLARRGLGARALADRAGALVRLPGGHHRRRRDTRHLVNDAVLDALGPRGFVINVARGSVIDEAALVRALADKRIAGAGLDVFENEPDVPRALFELDNVMLLPHIASGTEETRQAMADRADNLARLLPRRPHGLRPPTLKDTP